MNQLGQLLISIFNLNNTKTLNKYKRNVNSKKKIQMKNFMQDYFVTFENEFCCVVC